MKNYLYILLFLLLSAGCASEIEKSSLRTIADFYIGDFNNINRVLIIDQISGDRLNVTDKESIEGFLYAIKDVQFSPDKSQNQGKGLYKVAFFENDELTFTFETLRLSLGIMDGDYYYSEPDIFLLVENFLKDESVQIENENILIYEDIEKRSREYDWWYSLRSELPLENKEKWTK
ncbi:hypothetical protein CIB95_04950 [Lottiidibacillus patelloidae]|uniref:DUF4825 domain-containing protein n=1 Tax=Lottiidibacillus patelloidae TaxID=2670334 RepID=A0A263BX03_9BACI|nr:hypothetical protein [Lottiidibacillus patelloidae]OZM57716.1 hypothetical protein CIB95_04950 [Lottiidibacillus patelloidae]